MKLKIYNTLTKKKEVFKLLRGKEVRMYVCGPTVNDVPHLGHARSQISFDVLRRYLEFSGFKVKVVSNITDIEDKIINKAGELGISVKELSKKNEKEHMEDYKALNILKPTVQPHATDYVKEMIELVKKLEEKGYTYIIKGDGVYYDISKFKDYGKLSGQDIKKLKAGARVKVKDKKRNKEDFVLWKFSKSGEPSWESPWGSGRPGWHIECSAMSEKLLGLPLDIHGGGQDLIFPHHEDEIAQTEGAYEKKFVRYWIHNGMVNVDKIKMSKSLGNFKTIKDLLKDYPAMAIRYFVVSSYYRKPLDFSKQALDDAKNSYDRLKRLVSGLKTGKAEKRYLDKFEKVMDDDLNTPKALAVLWEVARKGNKETIKKIDEVFGLDLLKKEKIAIPAEIKKLAEERTMARKERDWKKADELREKIKKKGWKIEDVGKDYKLEKV